MKSLKAVVSYLPTDIPEHKNWLRKTVIWLWLEAAVYLVRCTNNLWITSEKFQVHLTYHFPWRKKICSGVCLFILGKWRQSYHYLAFYLSFLFLWKALLLFSAKSGFLKHKSLTETLASVKRKLLGRNSLHPCIDKL